MYMYMYMYMYLPSLQVDYAWDFDDFGRPVSFGFVILGSPKSD